jgi:hypothetical protein
MIKSIHHITIRDFSLYEKTGDTRSLVSGLWWKKKDLDARLQEIALNLGSEKDQDQALKKEHHRLSSLFRIEYLIVLYEATYNLIVNKTQVDVWKSVIGKNKGSDFTNLIEYVEKIEQETGIIIDPDNWQTGMIGLKWEIDRWTDKYAENFTHQQPQEGVTFMQIVLGVFAVLKFPINEEICLSDFFEMKRQAEKIVIQMKAQQDGR